MFVSDEYVSGILIINLRLRFWGTGFLDSPCTCLKPLFYTIHTRKTVYYCEDLLSDRVCSSFEAVIAYICLKT